jgi:hypothetical protein
VGTPLRVPGTVTLRSTQNGSSLTVRVPRDGKFTASVYVGTYTVTGHSPLYQDSQLPCFLEGTSVLRVPTMVPITVSCPLR